MGKRMRVLLAFAMVVSMMVVGVVPVGADPGTLYVNATGTCSGGAPCYRTIQAAVDAASAGDTIIVEAGTYNGNVDVTKANLRLLGQAGATVNGAFMLQTDRAGRGGSRWLQHKGWHRARVDRRSVRCLHIRSRHP
jgi:pectin methylesterase-like acyl-CoA thioesterase